MYLIEEKKNQNPYYKLYIILDKDFIATADADRAT